jgi:hypothetical protein
MVIFKRLTFWAAVWNVCEFLGIRLGKYAPYVFNRMIGGYPAREVDSLGRTVHRHDGEGAAWK